MFKDKAILITGGTGSFGNAVLRRLNLDEVKELLLSLDYIKEALRTGKAGEGY